MKLSHATIYALHALVYLASQKENRPVTAREIAAARGIPEKFLPKVLKPLGDVGVVQSLKGPNGGCRLARKPKDVTLLEVVDAVEGPWAGQIPFESEDAGALAERLQGVFDQATEAVRKQLQRIKLSDLVGLD